MEPSLIGWEWVRVMSPRFGMPGPQWSPALSAGNGSSNPTRRSGLQRWPQWSPALSAGNGTSFDVCGDHGRSRNGAQPYRLGMAPEFDQPQYQAPRRNGAQPYRLGMAGSLHPTSTARSRPQWSPALSAGNGVTLTIRDTPPLRAAMEPSLIGWEWLTGAYQHSAQSNGRNGAQPYRLGMAWVAVTLWRVAKAAMEPSLIGWEWDKSHANPILFLLGRNGAQPYRLGMGWSITVTRSYTRSPQWSPALSAGNGSSPLTLPLATSLAHVFEHCDPDAETDSLITLALG